jgi:hypothetical protein
MTGFSLLVATRKTRGTYEQQAFPGNLLKWLGPWQDVREDGRCIVEVNERHINREELFLSTSTGVILYRHGGSFGC